MMNASVATTPPAKLTAPRRSRLGTLAVMAVTTAIIIAVAVLANQSTTSPGSLTAVTLSGATSGAAPTVDQPAPDFATTTIEGRSVQLSAFKGQPVWLTFGASWCQPCRAENADIKAIAEKYAPTGLVVLAVFISEDAPTVKDYADRVGLDYLKVADPSTTIASRYRILGIPSHFFIDPDGILRSMKIGTLDPAAMEEAVAEIRR